MRFFSFLARDSETLEIWREAKTMFRRLTIGVNIKRKWHAEVSNAGPVHPNSLRSRVKVPSLRRNIAI